MSYMLIVVKKNFKTWKMNSTCQISLDSITLLNKDVDNKLAQLNVELPKAGK